MSMPKAPRYRRVILKISGESFSRPGTFGIDATELRLIAEEIAQASQVGAQMAVVVGGGNIIRGAALAESGGIDQPTADSMGMLGTVINGLALKEALHALGREARVLSAINLAAVAETFIRPRAMRHLEKGRVVILVAGTGNPFFTTDTAASLRAMEISAEVIMKATKVDGIYDKDPAKHKDAVRFDKISYIEVLNRGLQVMDSTAISLCMDHKLPILTFDLMKKGNVLRAVAGEKIGTLVH